LSFNIKNGKLFNSAIKIIDNSKNKKFRKTSIDVYPNYKRTDENLIEKTSEMTKKNYYFDRVKKNLVINFFDFPVNNKNCGETNEINYLDEYIDLGFNNSSNKIISRNKKEIKINNTQIEQSNTNILQKNLSEKFKNKDSFDCLMDDNGKKKKKRSLLRRTTSVPKLNIYGESIIMEKNNSSDENNITNISTGHKISEKHITDIIHSKNKIELKQTSHTESCIKNNSISEEEIDFEESENEKLNELNSPYNELFFYILENIVEEYIKSKFSRKN